MWNYRAMMSLITWYCHRN